MCRPFLQILRGDGEVNWEWHRACVCPVEETSLRPTDQILQENLNLSWNKATLRKDPWSQISSSKGPSKSGEAAYRGL